MLTYNIILLGDYTSIITLTSGVHAVTILQLMSDDRKLGEFRHEVTPSGIMFVQHSMTIRELIHTLLRRNLLHNCFIQCSESNIYFPFSLRLYIYISLTFLYFHLNECFMLRGPYFPSPAACSSGDRDNFQLGP
jgi:hypothetical protein